MTRTIVGIDGSENASSALRWAAARAERHGGEVVAVLAWAFFHPGHRTDHEAPSPFTETDAEQMLDDAVVAAGIETPVTKLAVEQFPAVGLVEVAGQDDLLVVGARGTGGFEGLLLGSVSNRVLELAPCPVAVIREGAPTAADGEIVVGVDGSDRATAALRWAAAEASTNGVGVRIITTWEASVYADLAGPRMLTALEDSAAEMVAEVMEDPALEGLDVQADVAYGSPAQALLAHAADASMIVVGSRGHGAFKRFLLGSTSRQVAQHASCPVVVVPGPR